MNRLFFRIFGTAIFLCYGEFAFFEFKMHAATARTAPAAVENGSVHYIMIWDRRLRTVLGCATQSPLYLLGDAAGRVFHPAQRPVERAPA